MILNSFYFIIGKECEAAVYDAIRMGYRHIDTSQAYGNEGEIGRAIKRAIDEGIVTRNDLFVSTKISFQKDSGRNVLNLVHMQLEKLKLNYIDLYMIHSHMASTSVLKATWHSITQMYYDGIIRAAGVSNFNSQQLEHLIAIVQESRQDTNESDDYHGKWLVAVSRTRMLCLLLNSTPLHLSHFQETFFFPWSCKTSGIYIIVVNN